MRNMTLPRLCVERRPALVEHGAPRASADRPRMSSGVMSSVGGKTERISPSSVSMAAAVHGSGARTGSRRRRAGRPSARAGWRSARATGGRRTSALTCCRQTLQGQAARVVVDVLDVEHLDAGLVHGRVVRAAVGGGADERVGVLAAARVEEGIELDLADLLRLELVRQRRVAVLELVLGGADERAARSVALRLGRQLVVAVVRADRPGSG